jgi:hypothetical protein
MRVKKASFGAPDDINISHFSDDEKHSIYNAFAFGWIFALTIVPISLFLFWAIIIKIASVFGIS